MLLLIRLATILLYHRMTHLHSTMLLLIPVYDCTDDSGRTSFTFHYASTYTIAACTSSLDLPCIYIPLCFYLYLGASLNPIPADAYLHSTMLLLIRFQIRLSQLQHLYLHSTMLLLIRKEKFRKIRDITDLHSTMLLLIHRQNAIRWINI